MQQVSRLTEKQEEAKQVCIKHIEILLEGGSRSGKTFFIAWYIIQRALKYPNSMHLCCRLRFNHAIQSLWFKTFPDVFKMTQPDLKYKENKQYWFFELPNGSQIWIGGLDDKERTEKILGNEYDTIHLNEASQLGYNSYEIIKTRLNPQKGVPGKLLIDYNPPSSRHWGYKIFHSGLNPETDQPLNKPKRYAYLKMNPDDNRDNLSQDYFDTLESMSESKQRRFRRGEYSDDTEGALWRRSWIVENRWTGEVPDLKSVVIGVDPAVTGNTSSDSTGISAAGYALINGEKHYFVIGDYTYRGSVTGWGKEAVRAYNLHDADRVIGEVNNGGDLVEVNIRNYDRDISYRSVRASRGKAIRAEPIADLYERGLVHHVAEYAELEDQMCTWTPDCPDSPDNMDALVWAITWLGKKKLRKNKSDTDSSAYMAAFQGF